MSRTNKKTPYRGSRKTDRVRDKRDNVFYTVNRQTAAAEYALALIEVDEDALCNDLENDLLRQAIDQSLLRLAKVRSGT